jgi:ectoine hydroxylase-related dioxygenase (phytanoyl-CoA dioxygenase family)
MHASTEAGRRLGPEAVEQFERDGYLVVDDACPPDLIDGVRAEIEPLLHDDWDPGPIAERDGMLYAKHGGWDNKSYAWHRVTNAWKRCDSVRALALSEPLLAIVEQLYGRRIKPFQTLNFPVGTEQGAHADSFHFQSDPPGYMCGIWVALEDMDMENGPLVYYPGTHKLPMPSWEIIERVTGRAVKRQDFEDHQQFMRARHGQYADYCRTLVADRGLEPRYATIRKGQALIWAANLLHGGSPQVDRARTRNSQVTHYFFEGCRVYTPMNVEDGHIYWDYPEWIRDPVPEYSAASLQTAVREHIPPGAHVLIAEAGTPDALAIEGYRSEPFPQRPDGAGAVDVEEAEAVEMLEGLRDRGARFLIVAKPRLAWLKRAQPRLQDHLETRYRRLFADGSTCAIYALE